MTDGGREIVKGHREIVKGHIYRAKKLRFVGFADFYNDRQVVYVSTSLVQYDSITVRDGRRYPTIDRTKFEAWAGEDVTKGYPEGDWAKKEEA